MKKNKKVFKITYKCAFCRNRDWFKKAYKHTNAITGSPFYVCKKCEMED